MSNFDKKYRQRMAEHEVPVPPDFFNRIQQERKKKAAPVFFTYRYCFLILIGVAVLGWATYWFSVRNNTNIVNDLQKNTTTSLDETISPMTRDKTADVPPKNTPTSLLGTTPQANNANKHKHLENKETQSKNNKAIFKTEKSHEDSKLESNSSKTSNPLIEIPIAALEGQSIEGNVNIALSPTLSQTSKAEIALLPSILPSALVFETPLKVAKRLGNDCFNFKKRKQTLFFVESYLSPQQANRSLSAVEGKKYLELRQSLEKPYWSFDGGVNVGLQHFSGFNIKLGVNYQQINEVFSYKIADYTMNTYNPDGSLLATVTGERYTKTYNRYRFVQIPLMVGYNFGGNQRNPTWHFGVHTGVGLNVLTLHRGNLVPPSDLKNIANFTTGSANQAIDPFKSSIGLVFYADFTVYRQLTKTTSVFFAPKYTHLFQSITKTSFPVQQKYSLLGLTVGMCRGF